MGAFLYIICMKKLLLFIGLCLVSCTDDINMPSYWVKNHSHKLEGDFRVYSPTTNEELFAKFIPAYWDSTADQSINIIWLSTLTEPQAFKFEELIENGISTFRISRCDLEWDRNNEKWCYLEWITYDVISHDVDANGFVESMETQRTGSQTPYVFERL